MKPADLRTLLEKASPRPWVNVYVEGQNIIDAEEDDVARTTSPQNTEAIVALVNLAPLLIELWETAVDDWSPHQKEILDKLEES